MLALSDHISKKRRRLDGPHGRFDSVSSISGFLRAIFADARRRKCEPGAEARFPPHNNLSPLKRPSLRLKTRPIALSTFCVGKQYEIEGDGQGKRIAPQAPQSFRLHLDKDVFLEAVYFAEYKGDLLFLCQISNGESGGGFIARLDERTLKTKWKRDLPGFNVGPALIESNFAYLTTIGFIGKIDLRSGGLPGRTTLFRNGDTFTSFELPQLDNQNVLFKEKTIYNPPAKTIVVEKQSGRILQIR